MFHVRLLQVILTILLFVTLLIAPLPHGSANPLITSDDILNSNKFTFIDDPQRLDGSSPVENQIYDFKNLAEYFISSNPFKDSTKTSLNLGSFLKASDSSFIIQHKLPNYLNETTNNPAPVVFAVSPHYGPDSGGTHVSISGENFIPGAYVNLGSAHCLDDQVISSSLITCQTPPYYPAVVNVRVVNPDGQSGTLWYGFTYHGEFATISLPHTSGLQHAIVQIPIFMANVEGLAAASLTIGFDENLVQALAAETGSLTPDWMLVTNTNTPGEIRLSMASTEGTVSGAGSLAVLHFELIGAPGEVSSMVFDSISLNDGELEVDSFNGSLSVEMVYTISGVIDFWSGGVVPSTTLSLSGSQDYSTQSEPDGMYTIAGVLSGDYTLTPSKSDDVNGISSYDASLVLQHDAGLIVLSEYEFLAGDVNKNGLVTSMDAYYILQYVVGLIPLPFPGADVVWDFVPSDRTYSELSSDLSDQDFIAILLGDPSGSWNSEISNQPSLFSELKTAELKLEADAPDQYGVVSVQVVLNQIDFPLYSLDLHLSYDPDLATILEIEKTNATEGWLMMANELDPGILWIGMASSEPLEEPISLLTLQFALPDPSRASMLIATMAHLNEGNIPVQVVDCQLGQQGQLLYLPLVIGVNGNR